LAATSSTKAVVLALLGNSFLTIVKFLTFAASGSGAMFSEALHSLADTANQTLLFLGIRRSGRPANRMFHYGFGGERFFYALMSAVGIFVLGCGVTLYHGVHTLTHPPELNYGWETIAVLVLSLFVDAAVMYKAIVAINEVRGDRPFLHFLRTSSDPTVIAVLLEDGVACLGVLIAMAGIGLSWSTQNPIFDSIATLLIGGMMGAIAIWLGYQNRTLILGKAIPAGVEQETVRYLMDQPSIEAVHSIQSRVVGADHFKFKAEVDWNGAALAEKLFDWAEDKAPKLSDKKEREAFMRAFGERMTETLGDEIDRIEQELRDRHPELSYLDFESD